MYDNQERKRRAVLVGINSRDLDDDDFDASLDELAQLVDACDIEVLTTVTQRNPVLNKATLMGSGKLMELVEVVHMMDADLVITNEPLTAMQIRNLEDACKVQVIDRTDVILEIFAIRARSREAKLQVEYARLQYVLPRLSGMHQELGRQGGASGSLSNKGSGEKKIELDRRIIEKRLSDLRKDLEQCATERRTQALKRSNSGIPRISLVGYTNAGKSSLMNALLRSYGSDDKDKQVMEGNFLFATLDTTVRSIQAPGFRKMLISDTVGFVSELPHTLVKAFNSTLEEATYADLLLNVIDYSDEEWPKQMNVTLSTLKEIGAGDIPVINVFNKADLPRTFRDEQAPESTLPYVRKDRDTVNIYMSAKYSIGLDKLIELIEEVLSKGHVQCSLLIPYSDGAAVNTIQTHATVEAIEYLPEGVKIKATLSNRDYGHYKKYELKED